MHYFFFSIFGLGYCDIELLFYSTFRVYRLLVEDYSKDFVLDLPIGYFCHDSAKNKFLDLFSALAAPKIRASMMRSITKRTHKARYSSAFWSEILVKDSLLSKEKILDMI